MKPILTLSDLLERVDECKSFNVKCKSENDDVNYVQFAIKDVPIAVIIEAEKSFNSEIWHHENGNIYLQWTNNIAEIIIFAVSVKCRKTTQQSRDDQFEAI